MKMSKSKDSNVSKIVLDYLKDQNDVLKNLQIEYGKTAVTEALDLLVNEGKVKQKVYGKQKVFYVNQDIFGDSKNEDLQTMDNQIQMPKVLLDYLNFVSKIVLDYLKDQNRPFNANDDVLNNLHIEYGKAAVTKALDLLVNEGKVKQKIYGKEKVFYVNQDIFGDSKNEDLQTMDNQIKELSNTHAQLQKQIKKSENLLGRLGKSVHTEMAKIELKALKLEIAWMKDELKSVESKNTNFDLNKMETLIAKKRRELNVYAKEHQRRKRIANNMIDGIFEGYPKSKKQLLEDLGVAVDPQPLV